ncbi:MAG: porin [Phycisphaerales bacterium]
MNRKMGLLVACGLAASLGGVASAQSDANRALSADIAADAASRTSYQGGSEGFAVPSSTGNSTLNIGGLVSFRTNLNFGDDDRGEDNDFVWGFALPHEQIWFYGNLFNPDFTYMIEAEFEGVNSSGTGVGSSGSGDFNLRDAWGRYQFENGAYVQAGQFKVDYSAETLTEDQYLLFAERSFVDEYFSADYTQGVRVGYEGETFHIVGNIYDGPWGRNLDWTDPAEADIAFGGRFDWLFSGQWVFDDHTSWRGSEFSGRLGGAVHWATYGETGFGAPADVDIIYYTIDVGVEGDGWNAFAAFLGDHIDADGADEVDNFGFVIQGGIFITDNTEIAGRVDFLFRDDDAFSGDEDQYFLTVGVNHYFFAESHAATAYANLVWGFQDTGDLIGSDMHYRGNTANGLLGNDDDEVALIFGFDALF